MANCTTIASKPTKLYRSESLDGAFVDTELIAGIKTITNTHHTYNQNTTTDEVCMDNNTIPASASTTGVTYGQVALTVVLLPAQHTILLGDSDLQTKLEWKIEYSDGSTDIFQGRATSITEDFSGDYMVESLTIQKTNKSTFLAA